MRFRKKPASAAPPKKVDPSPAERVRVVRLGSGEHAVEAMARSLWNGEWEWLPWQAGSRLHRDEQAAIDEARERVAKMALAEARASAEPKTVWP